MNPVLVVLGFLGPLLSIGLLGGGGGSGASKNTAPSQPNTPTPPVTPPDDEPEPQTPPLNEQPQEPEQPEPPSNEEPEPQDPPTNEQPQDPEQPTPPTDEEPEEPEQPEPPANEQPEEPETPETPPQNETPPSDPNPTPPEQTPQEPEDTPPATNVFEADAGIYAGRVTTLSHQDGGDIESIRITSAPDHGNVTVNPDNTLALVLTETEFTGNLSFEYEVTYADGSTASFEAPIPVEAGPQESGWSLGNNVYMLETDDNDDIVVEHGDNHREVYVSGSSDALTIADIAALEGLSAGSITDSWLEAHPEYGGSPDMALAEDAGSLLWNEISGRSSEASSNWLLFERGFEYEEFGLPSRGLGGESELHPIHITSYGSGSRPVIHAQQRLWGEPTENVVFSGIEMKGSIFGLHGGNFLIDDVSFQGKEIVFQDVYGLTIRNSEVVDAVDDSPNGETWAPHPDRESGIYVSGTNGILLEGNLFDHNGWEDGYDPNGSGSEGQPPSMFSHNVYLQFTNRDVTFRDNIVMRGASYGTQVRSGGLIEDNVFLDNNIAANFLGGDYKDEGPVGHYSLFTDNLITSVGYRSAHQIGAINWGVVNSSELTTLLDNIVAHMADPNNPDEVAEKTSGNFGLRNDSNPYYDDTIVYNWQGSNGSGQADQNVDGLNSGVLDQTTIQLFTAQLLGQDTATIADLADYLRAQANGAFDDVVDADLIISFFQQGFGIAPDLRTDTESIRFVPNDLGDGVRWDNRLNWSTDDLPGTIAGDSVDLAGNWVQYGSLTTTINDLDYGSGGKLTVTSGRLNVDGQTDIGDWGAHLTIDNSGQYWTDGLIDDDGITIDIDGGRFANTGDFVAPVNLSVEDNGQAVLASDNGSFDLGAGSTLELIGDDIRAGFDGDDGDAAVLRLDDQSMLSFLAGEDGDIATIEEFRSGAFGDNPDVLSGVSLGSAALNVDVSGFDDSSVDLIAVDELIGTFGDVVVDGLGKGQGAKVIIDYDKDTVSLEVFDGSGVNVETVGDELSSNLLQSDANQLWAALTDGQGTYDDLEFDNDPDNLDAVA